MTGGSSGSGSPRSPVSSLVPKKDDGKKKLQQFMHNARKVSHLQLSSVVCLKLCNSHALHLFCHVRQAITKACIEC